MSAVLKTFEENKAVRLIKPGVPLPECFAVITASSYPEAITKMRQAFADPKTHLVVWSGAGSLLSQDFKDCVAHLRASPYREVRVDKKIVTPMQKTLGKIFPEVFGLKASLRSHFNDIAEGLRKPALFLQPLYDDTAAFLSAIDEGLNARSLYADFRSEKPRSEFMGHFDAALRSHEFIALRRLYGDETIYFDSDDILDIKTHTLPCGTVVDDVIVVPGATRYITHDGDIAFHSRRIAHTAPWETRDKRGLQCFQAEARDNFVACALTL